MKLPRYQSYKDSGVEWIGRVPSHWNLQRMKASVASSKNGVWGGEPAGSEDDVPCVRVADFDRQRLVVGSVIPTIRNVASSERNGRILQAGDLLLEKSGGGEKQPVGQVVQYCHSTQAICSNFVSRVKLREGMASRFWTYLHFAAYASRVNTRSIKQTSGIQNLDQEQYFNEICAFPETAEQTSIAAFLDRETAKIDALIAEQERLLELLAEKRQAVISHAVTSGINPDAPMKDSGVAWLGSVPAHWSVMPIRLAARLESGHTPSRSREEWWENCTVPWFSLADVWQIRQGAEVIYETSEKISELGLANSSARLLPKGTVMLSRTASIGFSAIMGVEMATTQDFANWVAGKNLLPDFLLWVFRSMQGELRRLMMGSTHNTIYMPDIQSLRFALPPLEEQIVIVDHVRDSLGSFTRIEAEAIQGINLLKERRSALIAAAVTGQIDVREAA